ncbi:phosphoribosylanthranilate isomerase [Litchfieldia alkalitelluris]|uniref:phosphoribosylanthranilate isomerase n=1 Tax=Litchfieldia alkalitelluris TaxID=304268 RepID=UPI0009982116|nr:phosphoribosylanthranilate isomerase [Litchfieldia alkalitelluris]
MNSIGIKYCGNKSLDDLKITSESNANYLGFIFANGKRKISPSDLEAWLKDVNVASKTLVGVFVNGTIEEIANVLSFVPLSIIQCHGSESVQEVVELKVAFNKKVWKVIHHKEDAINLMKEFDGIADGYVIDSKVGKQWGGSGIAFDWSFIPQYVNEARRQQVPCFIAGGINKDNIRQLLSYDIDGIDVSSGIELENVKNKEIITIIEEQVKQK